jgi:hypothetical protein
MVSHLAPLRRTHFVTATAAPCTSIFKPLWIEIPDPGTVPQGTHDDASLFWKHERLHRATLGDYPARHAQYAGERDTLEHEFVRGALACADAPAEARWAFVQDCFARAETAETTWLEKIRAAKPGAARGILHERAWRQFHRQAKMPIE